MKFPTLPTAVTNSSAQGLRETKMAKVLIQLVMLGITAAAIYFFGKLLIILAAGLAVLALIGSLGSPGAAQGASGRSERNERRCPEDELTRRGGATPRGLSQLAPPPRIDI